MSSVSIEEARMFIDKFRDEEGVLTRAETEDLTKSPHILKKFEINRQKLGASIRAY